MCLQPPLPLLKVLIIGKTGVGKSSVINKLCGQKVAECGDSPQGVTKKTWRYRCILQQDGNDRHVELTDTSGIGDPTISFEDAISDLVCPQNGLLGEVFDVVLLCEKDVTRCEPCVRKALQVLDVCTEASGVKPWSNVIFLGTQADKWDFEDEDGNLADPESKFRNEFIPELVSLAKRDGAVDCSLPHVFAVTNRKHNVVKEGFNPLIKALVSWKSHVHTGEGVELRPFTPTILEDRYAKISGSADMGMSESVREVMRVAMIMQEMAKTYTTALFLYQVWLAKGEDLLRVLPTHITTLDALAQKATSEKHMVVKGKAGTAAAATAAAIMVWFPPTILAGIVCGIVAGTSSVATTVADSKLAGMRRGTLQEAMQDCYVQLEDFDKRAWPLQKAMRRFATSVESAAQAGVVTTSPETITGLTQATGGAINLAGHIGATIRYGALVSEVAAEGATIAASTIGRSLAIVGGAMAIADLAYSASQEPAHKEKLEEAMAALQMAERRVADALATTKGTMESLRLCYNSLPRNQAARDCNVTECSWPSSTLVP